MPRKRRSAASSIASQTRFLGETLEPRVLLALTPTGAPLSLAAIAEQQANDIAIATSGAFATATQGAGPSGTGLYLTNFDASAVSIGETRFVSAGSNGRLAIAPDGTEFVTWEQSGPSGVEVWGRIYSTALPEGQTPFLIGAGANVEASATSDGHFVSYRQYAGQMDGAQFDLQGNVGTRWQTPSANESRTVVIGPGGHLLSTAFHTDASSSSITAQLYHPDGTTGPQYDIAAGMVDNWGDGSRVTYESAGLNASGDFAIAYSRQEVRDRYTKNGFCQVVIFDSSGVAVAAFSDIRLRSERPRVIHLVADRSFTIETYSSSPDYVVWESFDATGRATGSPMGVPTSVALSYTPDFSRAVALVSPQLDNDGGLAAARYVTTPVASRLYSPSAQDEFNAETPLFVPGVSKLGVAFSEEMSVAGGANGATSVLNRANWKLFRNGVDVSNRITSITYQYDARQVAIGAVMNLSTPLDAAAYELRGSAALRSARQALWDGDQDGTPGGEFRESFEVRPTYAAPQEPLPLVYDGWETKLAADAEGGSVAVWTGVNARIYARRFNPAGYPREAEFQVSENNQRYSYSPDVAMDADGDFFVAWSQPYGCQYCGFDGAYGKRYNKDGQVTQTSYPLIYDDDSRPFVAISDNGAQIVFTTSEYDADQWEYAVAMDPDGDYAVAYSRYDEVLVKAPNQKLFQLSQPNNAGSHPSLGIDAAGNFVVAWLEDGVRIQRFNFNGDPLSDPLKLSSAPANLVTQPQVTVARNGEITVAWGEWVDGQRAFYVQRFDSQVKARGGRFSMIPSDSLALEVGDAASAASGDAYLLWRGIGPKGSVSALRRLPLAANVVEVIASEAQVSLVEGARLMEPATELTVAFSEPMNTAGSSSVTNIANWQILRNGQPLDAPITGITYAIQPDGTYLATMSLSDALEEGNYTVTASDAILGADGFHLNGDNDALPGGDFVRSFVIAYPKVAGGEIRLNQNTSSDQRTSPASQANTAMAADGAFVSTWASLNQDGSGWGVYARRFDAGGKPLGDEFLVNQTTSGHQRFSTVDADTAGRFVVTWSSQSQDGSGYGVYARAYSATGAALGNEFRVNETTADFQGKSAVALDDDGDFVIAWESRGQDGFGYGVYGRRFSPTGVALGSEFPIHQYVGSDQRLVNVATDAEGGFVATWSSFGQDGSGYGVYARRFSATGSPLADEFRVNETVVSTQQYSRIAMDRGGDFVVAWMSNGQDGHDYGIYARRFAVNGEPKGGEFRVNETTAGKQQYPILAMDRDGDLVVAWASELQDGDSWGVYARRYSPAGIAQGGEFRVNTTTADQQNLPSVAMDADGDYLVTWNSFGQAGDSFGVFAQRYTANSSPTAAAGGPYAINEGASLALDASGSMDPDVADALTYSWDINGDGLFGDATGRQPVVTLANLNALNIHDGPATLNGVRVRVTDSVGNESVSAAATLFIRDVAPTIVVTGEVSVNEGSPYGLTLGAITDPGQDTVSLWRVHWGDGQTEDFTTGGQTFHVYADGPATRSILVDLVDEDGTHVQAGSSQVLVANVAPQLAGLRINTISEGGVATLRGTIVDPSAVDGFILEVSWGDGSATQIVQISAGTTTFAIPHTYMDDPAGPPPDQFPIDIVLRDDDGAQDSESLRVRVNNIAPQATIAGLENPYGVGQLVELSATPIDPGQLDSFTYAWRVELAGVLVASGNLSQFSFTPASVGNYLVTLAVADDDAGQTLVTTLVNVQATVLPGDTNHDGRVDLIDVNNVRNNFGGVGLGDTDDDGDVDLNDLNAVRNNFGTIAESVSMPRSLLGADSVAMDELLDSIARERLPRNKATFLQAVDRAHGSRVASEQRRGR